MAANFVENAAAPFETRPPGRVSGPAAMRGTVQWLISQFPDLVYEIEAIVADGDLVVARVRARGTSLGRLNGFLPASGKRFDYAQSHWFRVVEGQLAEHWANRDDLSAMLQLGVVTPPRIGALLRQMRSAIPHMLRLRLRRRLKSSPKRSPILMPDRDMRVAARRHANKTVHPG